MGAVHRWDCCAAATSQSSPPVWMEGDDVSNFINHHTQKKRNTRTALWKSTLAASEYRIYQSHKWNCKIVLHEIKLYAGGCGCWKHVSPDRYGPCVTIQKQWFPNVCQWTEGKHKTRLYPWRNEVLDRCRYHGKTEKMEHETQQRNLMDVYDLWNSLRIAFIMRFSMSVRLWTRDAISFSHEALWGAFSKMSKWSNIFGTHKSKLLEKCRPYQSHFNNRLLRTYTSQEWFNDK
jgi:hypothetical protein